MSTPASWVWPEEPAEQVRWLEAALRGPDLSRLAAQFAAVAPDPQWSPPLSELMRGKLAAVLDEGLSVLDAAELRSLIQHPVRLIELQLHILEHGGRYWHRTMETAQEIAERQARRERLLARLDETHTPSILVSAPIGNRPARRSQWWLVSATAAALVVGIALGTRWHVSPSGQTAAWGWNKPDALPQQASRAEYLQALADGAEEWFRDRPATPATLAARILQFRQGCSRLILSDHAPLSDADRKWLDERCRTWAKSLDDTVAELEATGDATAAQTAVDSTVRKLIDALRSRSTAASALSGLRNQDFS